jgi:hypothetical protein
VLLVINFRANIPFWAKEGLDSQSTAAGLPTEIVEATYVDDEALYLAAPTAKRLEQVMGISIEILIRTFHEHGFTINWKPGKSEAIVQLRGRDAAVVRNRWTKGDNMRFPLPPSASERHMCICKSYKHVGGIIAETGSLNEEAVARARSASSAFVPLAGRLFSASRVSIKTKLSFATPLVFSRLFYNVCTWAAESKFTVRTLNRVYMQVLRRISDHSRFGAPGTLSDIRVRRLLRQPSVECILAKASLSYVARLLRTGPQSLQALLQFRGGLDGTLMLPWVRQIINDLRGLQKYYTTKLAALPDPADDAKPWKDMG